jgi:hypothetical protein
MPPIDPAALPIPITDATAFFGKPVRSRRVKVSGPRLVSGPGKSDFLGLGHGIYQAKTLGLRRKSATDGSEINWR